MRVTEQNMNYDPNNIFAKIIRGEIPCHKIYEDTHTLAFMDVMPQVEGHCLVVPKTESRNLFDIEAEVLAHLMTTVQKISNAALQALKADGVQIRQYNEEAAGQTVFHLHFHVLPMKAGAVVKPHSGAMADHAMLAKQAALISSAITL
jgi:histidine triad (HIT) family protein